jgi:uncharacterized protein
MHFVMKLSKLCNLRCTYCYEYEELGNKDRMPMEGLAYFFRNLADYLQAQPERTPLHFILHGGEALLLPHSYLREFRNLQRQYLDQAGIEYTVAVQSNLVKLSDATLDLLAEEEISLGISFDVFGDQRVDIKGSNSQDAVLENMQRLIDRRIPFGAIAVLHSLNIDHVVSTYHFYNELGINYRILPIFSHIDPPPRVEPLLVSHQDTVKALQQVAKAQFDAPTKIRVLPLWSYFNAAMRYLTGKSIGAYNPAQQEWAYIVNTNGDLYNHGDAYLPEGLMGNIFHQSLAEIRKSSDYQETIALRDNRLETCRRCPFDGYCNQLPIAEAIPSERAYDAQGKLQCSIAQPMIRYMIGQIEQSPDAQLLLNQVESPSSLSIPV